MNERRRSTDDDAQNQVAALAATAAEAARQVASLASETAAQVASLAAGAAAQVATLAATVAEHLRTDTTYPPEHKAFVQMLIEERAERLARNKRMQEKIAGSIILTGLLALLTWLGHAALQSLQIIK